MISIIQTPQIGGVEIYINFFIIIIYIFLDNSKELIEYFNNYLEGSDLSSLNKSYFLIDNIQTR